ncbi:MAG: glycoside hydrolase family 18 protein [Planctomycetota bacterium]
MSRQGKKGFRIIINDDFDSHLEYNQELFDLWGRTAATAFSLNIGADLANYPSKARATLGESLRAAHEEGKLPGEWGKHWYEFLVAEKKDPIAIAIEGCRRNGMEIFTSLRMNDIHHGADPEHPVLRLLISPFWREHPEFRAKGWERAKDEEFKGEYPEYNKERWDRRAWASYSFEHAEVRQRVLDVVREVSERYDIDGFDLDYSRQPPFFDRGRGYECRHHMTELVREARRILDEAGKKKGKRIKLAAPCRPTIRKSEKVGLDAGAWVKEGLVDILMPGQDAGSGTDFLLEEFLELAKGTRTEICPNIDNVAWPGVTANIYVDAAVLRAAAMRCHKGGAQGLQLFNFFTINERGHFCTQLFKEGLFSEIGEAREIEHKDKFYIFRQGLPVALTSGKVPEAMEDRGNYWLSLPLDRRVPPPMSGRKSKGRAEYRFNIADDIEEGRASGIVSEQRLSFSIAHAGPKDEIRFTLNGEAVAPEAMQREYRDGHPLPAYAYFPPYMYYEIDLAKVRDVRNGWNTLGIEAVRLDDGSQPNERFRGLDAVFYDIELLVKYGGKV